MTEEVKTKKCTKCGEIKPITEFGIHKGYPRTYCKKCARGFLKAWKLSHPEKQAECSRRWVIKNREKINAINKRYYEKNIEKLREKRIRNKYIRVKNNCCKILAVHHKLMKDDPEHLTTEFIKKLTGCKCKTDITE